MTKKIKCLETGIEIGGDTGIDIYKHVISVFNLPNIGVENLLKEYSDKDDERSQRIVKMLKEVVK